MAERRPNISGILTALGRILTTYIRVFDSPSSSGVMLYFAHIPIKVINTENTNSPIPAIRADFFAIDSSLDIKFRDIISGPRKYTPPITKS